MTLEFTYGVIDKCILRALRGHDSLIMTTTSMAGRVAVRVETYCRESGNAISVVNLNTSHQLPGTGIMGKKAGNNDSSYRIR